MNEVDYMNMSDEEVTDKKKWLFKESIRLEEISRNLEDERKVIEVQKGLLQRQQSKNLLLRKQLENQKNLFDKQWQLLEKETRRLACDKEKFQHEKQVYRDEIYREARRNMNITSNINIFFKGVSDSNSLKRRYKALLKIYHPDNMHGDKALLQAINDEYDKLTRYYLGT